ncbi:MAG TPA: DUF2332 domain-containing protein, partial [Acidimicrobiales bacterium]|nr:DUF2332 domain-containing protein [Acidimicrobiales bacterium]
SSCRDYSPIYDRVCRSVARDIEILDLVRQAPPPAHQPNVLLGAVHFLLLDGLGHPLADVYAGRSNSDPAPLFRDVCLSNRDAILEIMETRRTQTNECGRSALIGPALTWTANRVAAEPGRAEAGAAEAGAPGPRTAEPRTAEPIHVIDVGTSAGLNLLCDRYLLDYGDKGTCGPKDAGVRIECAVQFGSPPIAPRLPRIGTRIGIDRNPVDTTDEDDVRWLLACVWPDTGRLERTEKAIDEVRRNPLRILKGDALDALPLALDELPEKGEVCVLTTFSYSYFSLEERQRFVELLQQASSRRDITWISADGLNILPMFELVDPPNHDGNEPCVLGAVRFRDAASLESVVLAYVHAHGQWIDWRA